MTVWYDYPTERSQPGPIYAKPPGWSRAEINRVNALRAAAPQRVRNAAILACAAARPDLSFAEIGRDFGVSRNVVAGVLDRAGRRKPVP